MFNFAAGLVVLLGLIIPVFQTQIPTTETPIIESRASYSFNETLTFSAYLDSPEKINEMIVFWQPVGETTANQGITQIKNSKAVYTQDLTKAPLPPFAEIEYWFGISFSNGNKISTERSKFIYTDERFDEKNILQEDGIVVHWINGGMGFAQEVIDTAQTGIEKAQSILPALPAPTEFDPINIYIYSNPIDVQEAIAMKDHTWIAGQANPRINTILVSIPEGDAQQVELNRQVPHEIGHILLYRFIRDQGKTNTYQHIPVWLSEGLASTMEVFPNPDYPVLVYEAWQGDQLIPISTLCYSFPNQSSENLLAYAQSTAFVRYIQQQYGASTLEDLILNYADALECERGVEKAFGKTLDQLDNEWQTATFGEKQSVTDTSSAYSWLILFGFVIFIPLLSIIFMRRTSSKSSES